MNKLLWYPLIFLGLLSCGKKKETVIVKRADITESVYASGLLKSEDQYQAYSTVSGIIEEVYVKEGDTVSAGTALLKISSETQDLLQQNAQLAAQLNDLNVNQDKIKEAETQVALSKQKFSIDSINYFRQKSLWEKSIGSKAELEQRELVFLNSKAGMQSAKVRLEELKRQIKFTSSQAQNNLMISTKQGGDYIIKSEIRGTVFQLFKSKGEITGIQAPLVEIGNSEKFLLEMQVDEYDIMRIHLGMPVLVTLDSYKGEVFNARVSRIYPIMNQRSKTFLVEAIFDKSPTLLYPNMTFEASIVIQTKAQALVIPRTYLVNDTTVLSTSGEAKTIKTGLKDFRFIEVVSGLNEGDEINKPGK